MNNFNENRISSKTLRVILHSFISFLFIAFINYNLKAQQVLTLNDCINLALSQNHDMIIRNLNILKSEYQLKQTKKAKFPGASLSLSAGLNGGRSIDPYSNSFVQNTVSFNSYGLSGNWNIFDGFANRYRTHQNNLNVEIEQLQLENLKMDMKVAVIDLFMNIVFNKQLMALQIENEEELESQYSSTFHLIEEGRLAKYNLMEIESQLSNIRFEKLNIASNLDLALVQLGHLMNFFGEYELVFPDSFLISQKFSDPILSFHPKVKIYDKQLQSANYTIALAQSERLPRLSISAGLGTSYSSSATGEFAYFKQIGHNFNQYVGLNLTIPILTQTQIQVETAKVDYNIISKQKEKQELQLYQIKESLNTEIYSLKEKLKTAEINSEVQEKLYEGAKEKFKEGLISNFELNTHFITLEKAKIQEIQTRAELYFKVEVYKASFSY